MNLSLDDKKMDVDGFIECCESGSCSDLKEKYTGKVGEVYLVEEYLLSQCPVLKEEKIDKLIRALVLFENCFGNWGAGSSSVVHRFFSVLRSQKYPHYDELEEWAFQVAINPYIPFGSAGSMRLRASSANHYRQIVSDLENSLIQQKIARKKRLDKKRRINALRYSEQCQNQKSISEERKKIINSLSNIDPVQRIKVISEDTSHPIYYYPEDFSLLTEEQVGCLTSDTVNRLKMKLYRSTRGGWGRLSNKLNKLDFRS
ncbi:MAG: hypothetical protein ABW090_03730 [Sedimenticola sp.]